MESYNRFIHQIVVHFDHSTKKGKKHKNTNVFLKKHSIGFCSDASDFFNPLPNTEGRAKTLRHEDRGYNWLMCRVIVAVGDLSVENVLSSQQKKNIPLKKMFFYESLYSQILIQNKD